MTSGPTITLRNVSHDYRTNGSVINALVNVDLDIAKNEVVCIVGPSGCGKTTMANIVAGFLQPTRGSASVDGSPVAPPDGTRAVVLQGETIFPWMTVAENVGYAPRIRGLSETQTKQIVAQRLADVGLRTFADSWPRELSGGMKKRVEIARALASNPPCLVLDEPFGALDVLTRDSMQRLLLQVIRAEPRTVLLVTHDIEEALYLGDRVIVMSSRPGRVISDVRVPFGSARASALKFSDDFIALRHSILDLLRTGGADIQ